eukprot:gb/GEZN01007017.1/.p1 GENE.gb/GEZN01007017.1/~~gb/GEZN01007017.1/.p1  ORF type:complete len:490 (+),score=73.57 gb/GEZN01007017.1/:101-1570(+)
MYPHCPSLLSCLVFFFLSPHLFGVDADNLPTEKGTWANKHCFILAGTTQCSPSFFVIGTFKSGTTSLYKYLSKHPSIKFLSEEDIVKKALDAHLIEEEQEGEEGEKGKKRKKKKAKGAGHGAPKGVVNAKETNFFNYFNESRSTTPIKNAAWHMARIRNGGKDPVLPKMPESIQDYLDVFFPLIKPEDNLLTGEASPSYFSSPRVPHKLKRTFPHARLIVLLREPIERAHSRIQHSASLQCDRTVKHAPFCDESELSKQFDQYVEASLPGLKQCLEQHRNQTLNMHFGMLIMCMGHKARELAKVEGAKMMSDVKTLKGPEKKEALLSSIGNRLFLRRVIQMQPLAHSLYAVALKHWLRTIPREQILVIIAEDFYLDTEKAMKRVEKHLGLAAHDWSSIVNKKYNVGSSEKGGKQSKNMTREKMAIKLAGGFKEEDGGEVVRHIMTDKSRAALEEFFQEQNKMLGEVWWNKPETPWSKDSPFVKEWARLT